MLFQFWLCESTHLIEQSMIVSEEYPSFTRWNLRDVAQKVEEVPISELQFQQVTNMIFLSNQSN